MAPTQSHRLLAITTGLGADALLLTRFTLREKISAPFEIEAELAATDDVDLDKVVGHNATIRLELGKNGTRYLNGYVNRIVQTANVGNFVRYQATIVPWLWFLTRTSDCRVFQRKSALDIAEDVFQGHRFGSDFYDLQTSGTYPKRRYCVQYRETDFNFVSRLFESEGVYYWFSHDNGKHKLVLADRIGASQPAPGYAKLEFRELEQGTTPGREVITDWTMEKEVQPVEYHLKDFDFKTPGDPLKGKHEIPRQHGMNRFALYDYPGEYFEASNADHYAQIRLEELQAQYEVVHGVTTAMGLAAGGVFEMDKHPLTSQNQKYLITELQLTADAGEFASGGRGAQFFSCSFTAIPAATPYRPPRVTPKPIIQGPQTAVVVGDKNEEIDTDEHGRVKVQFHWDRYGKADPDSSCYVRVSQPVAGKGWGAISIPRIGQEVIVEFLEGDPDRPIITGRAYNGEAKPPYDLPKFKTMSAFKSNSSKGGDGFNEIRFQDEKGKEQIFMHGEKNLDIRIKNDRFETIENDRHLTVNKDKFEHIKNNRDETVDADHKEKIGKDRHVQVAGKEAKSVDGSLSLTVKGDVIEVFKAKHSEQTTGDYYLKADNVVIEGMTNVTVKVGQSSIAIEASGITIAAAQIEIQGQATIEAKSPNTTVKGDGQLVLKGGMVMINS
jgi:type VI secretion system secreted protein VgrG